MGCAAFLWKQSSFKKTPSQATPEAQNTQKGDLTWRGDVDDLAGPGSGGGARGVAGPGSRARARAFGSLRPAFNFCLVFQGRGRRGRDRESNLHVVDPQILVVIIHLTQNLREQINALRVRTRTPVYELGFTSTPIRPDCLTYNIFLHPPTAVTPAV